MKKVYNVGINDSDYNVQLRVGGKIIWRCPFYTKWTNMLKRCYGGYDKRVTYDNCKVCNEWLIFSNFKSWMERHDWYDKHLDKDLLGKDIYSPETCVFIPNEMNSFMKSSRNVHGLPTGVTRNVNGSLYARIIINGKNVYLGKFETVEDAVVAHRTAKIERAKELFRNEPLLEHLVRRLSSD